MVLEHTMTVEQIARVAHEVNRDYCLALGDASQPHWEEAPEWQRESAMEGVRSHLANPGLTPEASHQIWIDHKVIDGWVLGPEKDPERKTHPQIVPYESLPIEQRAKDYIFAAVVRALGHPVARPW